MLSSSAFGRSSSESRAMADAEKGKEGKNKKHRSLENLRFDPAMEMEILPRLPLRSILRLQLASKPLSPLISAHLRRHYSLPNAAAGLFFRWPISEAPKKDRYGFIEPDSVKNFYHALDSKFVIDDTAMNLPEYSEMTVIDCCNGLLLCQTRDMSNDAVSFVCNPLTGQSAYVPTSSNNVTEDIDYFYFSVDMTHDVVLAFDPCTSRHYSILHFDSSVVHVFSSETGRWVQKRAPSHKPQVDGIYPFFFDGKVYLASWRDPLVKLFNRHGKLVGKINLPHSELGNEKRLLGHSGGRLHYAAKVDDKMLVWVLDDPDNWVLKHTVSLQFIYDAAGPSRWGRHLMGFHPDMDVFFFQSE